MVRNPEDRFSHDVYLTDIDDCIEQQCQNSDMCQDGVKSYTCVCKAGFTGEFCQTSKHHGNISVQKKPRRRDKVRI